MKVAVLYNARPEQRDEGVPDDTFEEFDGPDTLAAVVEALAPLGVVAEPVLADRRLPFRLEEGRYDAAFNLAEGEGRRCREAVPAAVCELLGLPYTGSDPLTLAVTLDKAVARRLISPDVPVARGRIVAEAADLEGLCFPVIVKPNDEGSSKGIRGGPLAEDADAAMARVRWLTDTYHCPVLVEEFLPGVELTVGLTGDMVNPRVLGVMEIAPTVPSTTPFVYSLEVKRDYLRQVRYHVPARISEGTMGEVIRLAKLAWHILGCRDLSRLDFRLDADGNPRFIECNPLPGLNPVSSDIVLMTKSTLPYATLVQGVFQAAQRRWNL